MGGSGGGFLRHFGPDLVDFEGSERSQISSSKLEAKKWFQRRKRDSRQGSGGPIIDR